MQTLISPTEKQTCSTKTWLRQPNRRMNYLKLQFSKLVRVPQQCFLRCYLAQWSDPMIQFKNSIRGSWVRFQLLDWKLYHVCKELLNLILTTQPHSVFLYQFQPCHHLTLTLQTKGQMAASPKPSFQLNLMKGRNKQSSQTSWLKRLNKWRFLWKNRLHLRLNGMLNVMRSKSRRSNKVFGV